MIYSVRGKLIATEPGAAIVECGGVAFRCQTTMNTLRQLPPTGGEAMLYTLLNVRDDAMELFGFASRTELSCFRMLTGVTGVGAKIFGIAGPVIAFGTLASFVWGVVYWLLGKVG